MSSEQEFHVQFPAMQIRVVENEDLCSASEAYGLFVFQSQTIFLDPNNGSGVQRVTLLHELMHAGLEQLGIHEGHSEELIDGLANQLLFVLQNNPRLVEYLVAPNAPAPFRDAPSGTPSSDP